MTISKELFLSILAMDSYNRGYNAGIADEGQGDADGLGRVGSQIGNATVTADNNTTTAQSAGFYAVAYTVGAGVEGIAPGTTIISYRGTHGLTLGTDPVSGGGDILNGWLAGAGLPTSQTDLAIQFYQAATGQTVWQTAANTTVTGHSLGDRLAGLQARLFGNEAIAA